MKIDPEAIKILCFGDSNTWGYSPSEGTRYPVDVRWTGVLQSMLGDGYWIIEEGLNGRTTDVDDPDTPGRNGLIYLHPCLNTHNPIDIIIFLLGTNDTKQKFARSPKRIAEGLRSLLDEIGMTSYDRVGKSPQVIIVSPPLVDDNIEKAREEFVDASHKSQGLSRQYYQLAREYGARFLDLAHLISPSKNDGVHLEPADHRIIAENLMERILPIDLN